MEDAEQLAQERQHWKKTGLSGQGQDVAPLLLASLNSSNKVLTLLELPTKFQQS